MKDPKRLHNGARSRVVTGLVLVRIHGGPETGTINEKVELEDPELELFWN